MTPRESLQQCDPAIAVEALLWAIGDEITELIRQRDAAAAIGDDVPDYGYNVYALSCVRNVLKCAETKAVELSAARSK